MGLKPFNSFGTGTQLSRLLPRLYWAALILVFGALLGGYAYRGIYSRYLQDDYCYGAQVRSGDFLSAQLSSYLNPMPYNSDRYSLTLFSGFAEYLGGPALVPAIPALAILGWLAGLLFAVSAWQKLFLNRADWPAALVAALVLLFFSLYLAPNLYQVLFWRSAMLPYLAPLVFNTVWVGVFFTLVRRKNLPWFSAVGLGMGSFLSTGFSETAAFWQLSLWCLVLVFFLFQTPRQAIALKLSIILIAGTLLGLLVMVLCPVNAAQLSPFQRPDLAQLVTQSIANASIFIRATLKKMFLPFGVIAGFGFLSGLRIDKTSGIPFKMALVKILTLAVFTFVSILAVMVPSMIAMSDYPGGRAQLPAFFTLVVAVFFAGCLAAQFLTAWKLWYMSGLAFRAAAAILAGVVILYLASTAPDVYSNLSAYQHRAEAWDARNASILAARDLGENHVVVPAFDSIAQIFELYPQENFWVNVCAARYYQIKGISAVEGYNGIQPIFK